MYFDLWFAPLVCGCACSQLPPACRCSVLRCAVLIAGADLLYLNVRAPVLCPCVQVRWLLASTTLMVLWS
jgi:hypothetical protein